MQPVASRPECFTETVKETWKQPGAIDRTRLINHIDKMKKKKKRMMQPVGFEPTPLSRPENSLKQWKN